MEKSVMAFATERSLLGVIHTKLTNRNPERNQLQSMSHLPIS
jgi:hypothetical protein